MRTLCKKLVSCRRAIPESRVSPCWKMPLKHRASGICKYLPGFRNKYFLNLKTRPRPFRSGAGSALRRFRSRGHDSQKNLPRKISAAVTARVIIRRGFSCGLSVFYSPIAMTGLRR